MSSKDNKNKFQVITHRADKIDDKCACENWINLKNAIQEIQKKNYCTLSFEELYRNAYIMVLNRYGDQLYVGLEEVILDHLTNVVYAEVIQSLENNFLQTLNSVWNDHQISMSMIREVLMYMDRVYMPKKNVKSIFDLGLIMFRDHIIRHENIESNLQQILLDNILRERQGEIIDRLTIRNTCKMLMILSLGTRSVYEDEFENPFLNQSSNFYAAESQKFLEENNIAEYLKKVERRVNEESERAIHCLDESTEKLIVYVAKQEFIRKHLKEIVEMENSGVKYMLIHVKTDDLARMYRLFSNVSGALDAIVDAMGLHLREKGIHLVKQDVGENKINPVHYILKLLEIKDKFNHFLCNSFSCDIIFKQRIDSEFEFFLNQNSKSPEYLALFIDDKLKKTAKSMTEDEIECILDKSMVLFRYLIEKDFFERYYKQHLAKRLLLDKNRSDDAEKSMISKLKMECGYQFTSKLEGMFKDISISKTMMNNFKVYSQSRQINLHGIDLRVYVLTTGFWPTQGVTYQVNLPVFAENTYKEFCKFYLSKHTGRQLTLQSQLGSAELNAIFYIEQSPRLNNINHISQKIIKKHIFSVTTYQMCILMLFNNKEQITLREIVDETGLSKKDAIRSLQALAVGKINQHILLKTPKINGFQMTDVFSINDGFKSSLHRVKIQSLSIKNGSDDEQQETINRVEDNRKHEIEAAIVRIMKSRKKMTHPELVAEVTNQLKSRFSPSIIVIKRRIENLIQREYLARTPNDKKVYTYVG